MNTSSFCLVTYLWDKQILQLKAKPWIIISASLRDAEYLLAEANRGMSPVSYLKSEKCLSWCMMYDVWCMMYDIWSKCENTVTGTWGSNKPSESSSRYFPRQSWLGRQTGVLTVLALLCIRQGNARFYIHSTSEQCDSFWSCTCYTISG